jgi:hypothetical protein
VAGDVEEAWRCEAVIFREETMDLFDVDESYFLAHCVASDVCMGAGIAVPMNAKFGLRKALLDSGESLRYPTCVLTGRVFNLITKERSNGKPTMKTLENALWKMKVLAEGHGVKKIAMPRIGCGLDRLNWPEVKLALQTVFANTDIELLVCVR